MSSVLRALASPPFLTPQPRGLPREGAKYSILEHAKMSRLPALEPSFICTFCWSPQYPPSKPKLVGSSRISCAFCHAAVLNLSICWACGEIIVRSQEVVSLGWCFWHRSCFGCLLCATRIAVPKEFEGRSIELDHISLCGVCEIETAGEHEEEIRRKGAKNVGHWDGGVSQARLRAIESGIERDSDQSKIISTEDFRRRMAAELRSSSPRAERLLREADPIAVGDKASLEALEVEQDIYLSVLDPLGDLPFRPSPTKPLPHWMKVMPINRASQQESPQTFYSQDIAPQNLPTIKTDISKAEFLGASSSSSIAASHSRQPSPIPSATRVRVQTQLLESPQQRPNSPKSFMRYPETFPTKNQALMSPIEHTYSATATAYPISTSPAPTRELTSYPFFQNPRQPILPGIESSWGTKSRTIAFVGNREFIDRLHEKGTLLDKRGRISPFTGRKGEGEERELRIVNRDEIVGVDKEISKEIGKLSAEETAVLLKDLRKRTFRRRCG